MNGNHWSDFTEAELAAIRHRGTVHASRRSRRPSHLPDMTAETRAVLAPTMAAAEPAYPAEWLPEVAARATLKATQTPADWLRDNAPDPHEHRNGTAPAGSPPSAAYPAEWLSQADLHPPTGGLGGEGFLNRRAA